MQSIGENLTEYQHQGQIRHRIATETAIEKVEHSHELLHIRCKIEIIGYFVKKSM